MSIVLHVFNLVSEALPSRGGFELRRGLLVMGGVRVARDVRLAAGVHVYDRYLEIGSGTWVGMDVRIVSCAKGVVRIGSRVDIAPMCLIDSGTHELGGPERRAGTGTGRDIVIGDGCWIGLGSRVLAGARIGRGCVVAAGAVVVAGDYAPDMLIAGIPARCVRALAT
jgi:maltose O-acetyltransferase